MNNTNIKRLFIVTLLLFLQSCSIFGKTKKGHWKFLTKSLQEKSLADSLQDLKRTMPEKLLVTYAGPIEKIVSKNHTGKIETFKGNIIHFIAYKSKPGQGLAHLRYLLSLDQPNVQEAINAYVPLNGTPLNMIIKNLEKIETETADNQLEKIKLLLEKGAQVNIAITDKIAQDKGENELHKTVQSIIYVLDQKSSMFFNSHPKKLVDKILEVVRLLVQHGVNVEHTNAKGEAPLSKLQNELRKSRIIEERTQAEIIKKFKQSLYPSESCPISYRRLPEEKRAQQSTTIYPKVPEMPPVNF